MMANKWKGKITWGFFIYWLMANTSIIHIPNKVFKGNGEAKSLFSFCIKYFENFSLGGMNTAA